MSGSGLNKSRETFRTEAAEILEGLDYALITAEKTPDDPALIDQIFRGFHTIKGSGAMFGCDRIAGLVHTLESVFDRIRDGDLTLTPELTDLSLRTCDHVRDLLHHPAFGEDDPAFLPDDTLLSDLEHLLPVQADRHPFESTVPDQAHGQTVSRVYQILFHPDPGILRKGINPVLLLSELCNLGTCAIAADIQDVPDLDVLEPDLCLTTWTILLKTPRDENTLRDIFIFVEGNCSLTIENLGETISDSAFSWLCKQLKTGQPLSAAQIQKAERQSLISREKGGAEQDNRSNDSPARQSATGKASIRVASGKLDKLVNLLGELVILQAGLKGRAEHLADPQIMAFAERIERLTWDLRETGMSMRLLPVGVLFNRYHRLVRDLSKAQNKQVTLSIHGEETELDKSLIEHLNDPLMHLIRNCIDHGLESPEDRLKSGKPAQGSITLSAEQSGFDILITVADDGAGLDMSAIRKRAISKGLLSDKTEYTDRDLEPLIFMPGFSSRDTVSETSGRGVGMDVVKSNMEALGGSITLSSRKQNGLSVTLRVPLTLGIIEGLLVHIGENRFVFPLSSVEECMELSRNGGNHKGGRQLLNLRDQAVPTVRLRDHFGMHGSPPQNEEVLITRSSGQTVGFVVDHIIGNQQIVIKPLGNLYKGIAGLSGATILGNGTVGLILDIPALTDHALQNGNAGFRHLN